MAKWQVSVHVGPAWTEFNGGFSTFNRYVNYGKVPYDLNGYETYFKYSTIATSPASGFGITYSGKIDYRIHERFTLSLSGQFQPSTIGVSNNSSQNWDGEIVRYGNETSFSRTVLLAQGSYLFKMRKKSYWAVSASIGSSYMELYEMVFLQSELTQQGAFNGTAYDYIDREDWAFTWGLGLSYTYNFSKHWRLVGSAELTTFNLKPTSATRYSYKIDGVELVKTLPIREQQFIFTDQYSDRPDEPNAAQVLPAENYRYFVPQFTLGVGYSF